MTSYDRIAAVIRYLDAHHREQPSLAVLADQAQLSTFHFHRLFSTWAGITPKDFLQCITVTHAKTLLRRGNSILDASLEIGLSGPGRLHDLCVELEAASPGELKLGGEGWTVTSGFVDTPFGRCLIGAGPRGICHLSFTDPESEPVAWTELQAAWPSARLKRADAMARQFAARIFAPSRNSRGRPLPAVIRGTPFQVKVWRALLRVRGGTLTTYARLAEAIGQPTAARAVGNAVATNPLAYLIPCHRVIRETGALGEYRWDQVRKRAMLAWESGGRSHRDS